VTLSLSFTLIIVHTNNPGPPLSKIFFISHSLHHHRESEERERAGSGNGWRWGRVLLRRARPARRPSRPAAGGGGGPGGGGPAVPGRRRRGADGGRGGAAEPRESAPPPRLPVVPLSSDRGAATLADVFAFGGSPDAVHHVGGSPVGVAFMLLILALLYYRSSLFGGDGGDDE